MSQIARHIKTANSSVAPSTLPGPRVEHLDRADNDGLPEEYQWPEGPRGPDYGTAGGSFVGESSVPDAHSDPTPTQGYDFGVGRGGGNDAHGQGAGGYGNPGSDGKGVYGPKADLPNDPGGKMHDREESDSMAVVEQAASGHTFKASAELPNDNDEPVARSDYYTGPKGNDVGGTFAQSEMPGTSDSQPGADEYDLDLSPTTSMSSQQQEQARRKWDDTTHEIRPDYTYQRGLAASDVKAK